MNLTTDPDRPLSWFRFEAEFATSPRIGTLPEYTQLVLVWAMCATARRVVPCSDADFAWWTRSDLARIEEAKRLLLDSGLITDEWVPTDWHRCQPPTDRTNAERQRRHRERQKEVTNVPADNPEDRNAVTNALLTPTQDRTGQTGHNRQDRTGHRNGSKPSHRATVIEWAPSRFEIHCALARPLPPNRQRGKAQDGRLRGHQ